MWCLLSFLEISTRENGKPCEIFNFQFSILFCEQSNACCFRVKSSVTHTNTLLSVQSLPQIGPFFLTNFVLLSILPRSCISLFLSNLTINTPNNSNSFLNQELLSITPIPRQTYGNCCNSSYSLMDKNVMLGLLRINVIRGINLARRDFRSSDPYVIVRMGKQVRLKIPPFEKLFMKLCQVISFCCSFFNVWWLVLLLCFLDWFSLLETWKWLNRESALFVKICLWLFGVSEFWFLNSTDLSF